MGKDTRKKELTIPKLRSLGFLDKKGKQENQSEAYDSLFPEPLTKVTTQLGDSILEKLKDYCYWKRITQEEMIRTAIIEVLEKETIEPRPAYQRHKKRGRKPTVNKT